MRILFFDTETNGLPKFKTSVAPSEWPAVVQVAWQVWDFPSATDPVLHSAASYYVKPSPSLEWNLGSQAIHLVTKEQAIREGAEPEEVWGAFAHALADVDCVVAHNLAFDKKVVDADAARRGAPPYRWPSKECCTMMSTTAYCRLPSMYSRPEDPPREAGRALPSRAPLARDPYKFPKLSELHALLFGNARLFHFHNASVDVDCTVQCFRRLVELKVLRLEGTDDLRVPLPPV